MGVKYCLVENMWFLDSAWLGTHEDSLKRKISKLSKISSATKMKASLADIMRVSIIIIVCGGMHIQPTKKAMIHLYRIITPASSTSSPGYPLGVADSCQTSLE